MQDSSSLGLHRSLQPVLVSRPSLRYPPLKGQKALIGELAVAQIFTGECERRCIG